MPGEIEKLILAEPGKFFPGEAPPRSLSSLLVKGSLGASGGRVTFLVFRDGRPDPALAVKIARDPEGERLLSSEASALRFMAGLSGGTGGAAPRLVLEGNRGAAGFIAEEAVRGTPLGTELAENGYRTAAARVEEAAGWLGRLGKESSAAAGAPGALQAAEKFAARYKPAGGRAAFLEDLKAELARLDSECPRVFAHGDLSPMNLYFGQDGLRVIDWAESSREGFPLHDLFFLLTCLAPGSDGTAEGARRLDNFSSLFFAGGELLRLTRGALRHYRERLELADRCLPPLLALFLMERANMEYEVLERQGRRGYLVPMEPFCGGARWEDGSLLTCGLYGRLFGLLADNYGKLALLER